MERKRRLTLYFSSWICLALVATCLNFLNINFADGKTHLATGIIMTLILGVVQGSVLEYPIQTIACLLVGGWKRDVPKSESFSTTLILNYNLLASNRDDIDECMKMMFTAYMGNLSHSISAVLVSATRDETLKEYELFMRDHYRILISKTLHREGMLFAKADFSMIDSTRLTYVWAKYKDINLDEFKNVTLNRICDRFSKEFMVIHRVSRVLRKCGQYQDLMLLSSGESRAFTYCDEHLYNSSGRKYDEPLFHDTTDVKNILGRNFDYTLVLDADTGLPKDTAYELLKVAEAHPERGIIQPAINITSTRGDTVFMHLESMRQKINEPLANSNGAVFEQCSFFGKALIKNKTYISEILGTRDKLVECVPIDVLSHDTFEATLLKPLYVGTVFLEEAPCYNYVSWNIRERRWNKGEILLAIYFWKNVFGKPMRWLQRHFQAERFTETKLRTETKLDFVSGHIAHAAIRQMVMKPLLLIFILIHIGAELKYKYIPIIAIMFLILVFPKFATCNRRNFHLVILETLTSILQFTPEALIGTIRIFRSFDAVVRGKDNWIPQKTVENEFRRSNAFLSSFRHLWGYSFVAAIGSSIIVIFYIQGYLVLFMFLTVFILPIFTWITSLPFKVHRNQKHSNGLIKQTQDVNSISQISSISHSIYDSTSSLIPGCNRTSAMRTHFNSKANYFNGWYHPFKEARNDAFIYDI